MAEQSSSASLFERGDVFVEAHYYDGGLRNKYVSFDGNRPTWAPKYDWVGFRDEVRLREADYAIEIVKFAKGDSSVSWVAIYTHAPDAKYGDRNNHAGVGLWMRDQFPLKPNILVDGLRKLLEKQKTSSAEDFESTARKFLVGFVDKCISSYARLAAPLNGLVPATDQAYSTANFFVPDDQDAGSSITDLFWRAFFYLPVSEDVSRLLIHVSGAEASPGFTAHQRSDFTTDLVTQLPAAFSDQAKLIGVLSGECEELREQQAKLDQNIDQLQTDKAGLEAELHASKRQYEDFKRSIEQNDELKRFSVLHDGLTAIQGKADEIIRQMPQMQRAIANEVREETRKAMASRSAPSTNYPRSDRTHASRASTSATSYEYDWLKVGLFAFLVLLVVGLLGWGIYELAQYLMMR